MDTPLAPEALAAMTLAGRRFLHEQGSFVVRGRVDHLSIDEDYWSLTVKETERYDSASGQWVRDLASDDYGGHIRSEHSFEQDETGLITLNGYGLVVYIAPADANWSSIDWPETDVYPGGPM